MVKRIVSVAICIAVLLFIYAPILLLVVYSFTDSNVIGKWDGFSFNLYAELFRNAEIMQILFNTVWLALAAAIAVLFFALAPFSYEVKKAVAITAFAPISSASPAFVAALKGDVELVGFASTISIIISLILMPLMIVFL